MTLKFNNLKELFSYNVKYYRYVNNFSQERLAELCLVSSKYLTDIERGRHCPTFKKIENIANAFNIEPYVLFQNVDRDEKIVNKINSGRQYNQNNKSDEKL